MNHIAPTAQTSDYTEEFQPQPSVVFDPEQVQLEGHYRDQLSAYRAKRVWTETLSQNFLLDTTQDFTIQVRSAHEQGRYKLTCEFQSACARYAFWRLTNHQAPEAQYMIETAHIPRAESRHEDFISAPDLQIRHSTEEPAVLTGMINETYANNESTVSALQRIVAGLIKKFTL